LKGRIVFDVGTGAGGTLFPFLQAGWRVIGVDVERQYLDYGRSKGLELHEGSFDFFMNRGLKADLLILCHVFEHLEDLDQAVSKIRQCLKPNGFVYIEVPGIFNISSAYENNFLRYLQNAHLYHFSLQTLSNVLRENGFELVYGTEYVKSIFRLRTDFSTSTLSSASYEEIAKEILIYLNQMDSFQGRLKGKMALMRVQARRLGVRALEIIRLKGMIKNLLHKT
ncbi:MAG: class I SAM-dependent methyltransferase, partial [Candidatus Hodarchaeota archaeon]